MDLLEVARIVKPHGLRGEVGVLMHWEQSDAMLRATQARLVLVDGTSIDRAIVKARQSGRGYLVTFAQVESREAAETLRGARVLVDRAVLPEAQPGEAFLSDLIGREVVGPDASNIGRVVDIATYPSVDCIVIERPDGSRIEQPLVDDWVEPLEAQSDRVVLRSLDGLVAF